MLTPMNDLCLFYNGDRGKNYPSSAEMVDAGVPFINAGDINNGTVDITNCCMITFAKYRSLGGAKLCDNDILYCLRGSIGKNGIFHGEYGALASSLVAIRANISVCSKYLYYLLNSTIERKQRVSSNNGAAQPNLSVSSLQKYAFPVPSSEEQARIVSILDRFDALVNDITQGLPAELAARRRQYEYYRDKLLTFREKAS